MGEIEISSLSLLLLTIKDMKYLIILALTLISLISKSQTSSKIYSTNDTSIIPKQTTVLEGDLNHESFVIVDREGNIKSGFFVYYPNHIIADIMEDTLTLDSLYGVNYIRFDGQIYQIVRHHSLIQPSDKIQSGSTILFGANVNKKKPNTKKPIKSSTLNYQSANKQWEKLSSSASRVYSSVRAQSVKIMDSLTNSLTKFLQ